MQGGERGGGEEEEGSAHEHEGGDDGELAAEAVHDVAGHEENGNAGDGHGTAEQPDDAGADSVGVDAVEEDGASASADGVAAAREVGHIEGQEHDGDRVGEQRLPRGVGRVFASTA